MKPVFKKSNLFIFTLLFSLNSVNMRAQQSTGINNPTPSLKAAIDIGSALGIPQGILVPRLSANDTAFLKVGITNAERGLLFYDTIHNVYRFWNGTKWMQVAVSGTNERYWKLNGNDLNPSDTMDSNFAYIGTKNFTPLIFGTNGGERMRISRSGFVGIGTSTPLHKLHVQSDENSNYTMFIVNNAINGISGGGLHIVSSGQRTISNNAVLIENLVTKFGGSNSTKVGLRINSTGSWGPGTINQPNIGLWVDASGADSNYAAVFNTGNVGIQTPNPKAPLHIGTGNWDIKNSNGDLLMGNTNNFMKFGISLGGGGAGQGYIGAKKALFLGTSTGAGTSASSDPTGYQTVRYVLMIQFFFVHEGQNCFPIHLLKMELFYLRRVIKFFLVHETIFRCHHLIITKLVL